MTHSALPRLLRALTAEPLAAHRPTFDLFVALLRKRGLEGLSMSGAELHAELEIAAPRQGTREPEEERGVAVIPVVGAIANRGMSMATGAMNVGRQIDRAVADARVSAIVLDVESPGGTVGGVPELASKIFRARERKPVVAVANDLMASAAYWIGSAASEVVATPSADIGSIGVFTVHEDWTQWLENEGIKITEISAGKFKTEGAPWKPLGEDARVFLDARVQEVYEQFTADVARFRSGPLGRSLTAEQVQKGFGEGRVLSAEEAVKEGLADRIATLDDVVAELLDKDARAAASTRTRRAAAVATDAEVRRRKRARA